MFKKMLGVANKHIIAMITNQMRKTQTHIVITSNTTTGARGREPHLPPEAVRELPAHAGPVGLGAEVRLSQNIIHVYTI